MMFFYFGFPLKPPKRGTSEKTDPNQFFVDVTKDTDGIFWEAGFPIGNTGHEESERARGPNLIS